MSRRAKPRSSGQRKPPLRWVHVGEPETHSVESKMSDALMQFVGPVFDTNGTPTPEEARLVLRVGVFIWNLGTYETLEWRNSPFAMNSMKALREYARRSLDPEEFFRVAEALLHRRRTLFREDRREIVDFEILPDPECGYRLQCTWGMPDPGAGVSEPG